MVVRFSKTICSVCHEEVGVVQQPQLAGHKPSYRVRYHKVNGKRCDGTGEDRTGEQGIGLPA